MPGPRHNILGSRHEAPQRLRATRLAAIVASPRMAGVGDSRYDLGQRRALARLPLLADAERRVRAVAASTARLVATPARRRRLRHAVVAGPIVGRAHHARLAADVASTQRPQHGHHGERAGAVRFPALLRRRVVARLRSAIALGPGTGDAAAGAVAYAPSIIGA